MTDATKPPDVTVRLQPFDSGETPETNREQKPFNKQAAELIDTALDLIKKVLVKHSAAVLEEMHDQIVKRNERIAELEDELEWEDTEKSNYCQILTALGMEEEGDPVEGLKRLNGSVATLESECNQLNDMTIKQRALIDDLASAAQDAVARATAAETLNEELKARLRNTCADNPSGMRCDECRSQGVSHCADPVNCGGMKYCCPARQSALQSARSEGEKDG